jgi:hypothetical protein
VVWARGGGGGGGGGVADARHGARGGTRRRRGACVWGRARLELALRFACVASVVLGTRCSRRVGKVLCERVRAAAARRRRRAREALGSGAARGGEPQPHRSAGGWMPMRVWGARRGDVAASGGAFALTGGPQRW